jgi:L-fucose mutarotase
MLKNIPAAITPELMKVLMEMGHGDEIILADANFPAISVAKRFLRCDGVKIPELLDAILKFFPLDSMVDKPVALMELGEGQDGPPNWPHYLEEIGKYMPGFKSMNDFEYIERFDFYDRAKGAFAIVTTGDISRHANILLKKDLMTEYPK